MDKFVVASAQQQMRLFDSPGAYRRELIRFLAMAHAKAAKLVVFPPLAGVMANSHEVEGFRVGLLKQASERSRGARSIWNRTRSAVAEGTAALLGASYRRTYVSVLQAHAARLGESYRTLFADLARTYEMTLVAGSAYLPDEQTGDLRHRVTVYGPDGALLGHQDKLILSHEDAGVAAAGDAWRPIDTPVGRIGILLEQEALYPEAGRVLAYTGADILISLAAVGSEPLAAYIRQATLAHAQANRCFALSSFLVGKNYLAAEEGSAAAFLGKSGIYAPLDMTPRYSGVLVEMGASDVEGLVTAEFDRDQLHYLWEHGAEPVRKTMPVSVFAATLPALYAAGRTLDDAWRLGPLPAPQPEAEPVSDVAGVPTEPVEPAWPEPEDVPATLPEETDGALQDEPGALEDAKTGVDADGDAGEPTRE